MPSVLISGASTGIGLAAAQYLAEHGWIVFAGVRKTEDGDRLKEVNSSIHPIILDVTKPDQISEAMSDVSEALQGKTLSGLVNNAGIANMAPIALQSLDDFKAHFEVNCFGTLALTQAALPLLGMDKARNGKPGRIINITSMGGELTAPFLGAYCATKHAVESLTDSFRRELMMYGIDAITIGPGSVKTPIWEKAGETNKDTPYKDTPWGASLRKFADEFIKGGEDGLEPVEVARVIEIALTDDSPKTRYAPVPNKLMNWTLPRLLPTRMVDKIMGKRYGLMSDNDT
ncbi:MAG: short-chain dehydrogenase [Ponticaulis sp.]|nr:short-chain dehydrogenase [Ponticaulis sp.]|tara:strand:+ start:14883 stop:15743 length:861 start_codon:yes stop_codon:yes gene_type:complete